MLYGLYLVLRGFSIASADEVLANAPAAADAERAMGSSSRRRSWTRGGALPRCRACTPVIVTGNHFVLDSLAGAVVALAALALRGGIRRRR
jgi:hypothetical protein